MAVLRWRPLLLLPVTYQWCELIRAVAAMCAKHDTCNGVVDDKAPQERIGKETAELLI